MVLAAASVSGSPLHELCIRLFCDELPNPAYPPCVQLCCSAGTGAVFAVTGITLNHRDWFSDHGSAVEVYLSVPDSVMEATDWQTHPLDGADTLRRWLSDQHDLTGGTVIYDWDNDEQLLMIDIKRPGGYSLVEFSLSQLK
ncbi:PepSY-associated TM helix domain-containing protein [Aliamphritea spongicola]|nr:PepSY-associated TM helix domain-containing protein [Aliamphritea spongicola]